MATTYNIVEKRYNGTDYDTLYPATKGENLVSAVPLELGGTGGTTGAAGMKNLIDALSTVTPVGTDLLPLKDVSGNIAGKATIDSILSLVGGGAKIQTGSYVGTGTYGQDNPCSLTFDFEPKVVFLSDTSVSYNIVPIVCDAVKEVGAFKFQLYGIYWGTSIITYIGLLSMTANTLSWYNTDSVQGQLNISGTTYPYVAIG